MNKVNRYLRNYELDIILMKELEKELFELQDLDMYTNKSKEIKSMFEKIEPVELRLRRRSLYFIEELQNNKRISDNLIENILEALAEFVPEIEYDLVRGLPINFKTIKIHSLK